MANKEDDTGDKILQHLWLHIDLGAVQWSARWVLSDDVYKYKHGDEITTASGRGTFRIFDKDYDKEWIKNNVDELKVEWEKIRKQRGNK